MVLLLLTNPNPEATCTGGGATTLLPTNPNPETTGGTTAAAVAVLAITVAAALVAEEPEVEVYVRKLKPDATGGVLLAKSTFLLIVEGIRRRGVEVIV